MALSRLGMSIKIFLVRVWWNACHPFLPTPSASVSSDDGEVGCLAKERKEKPERFPTAAPLVQCWENSEARFPSAPPLLQSTFYYCFLCKAPKGEQLEIFPLVVVCELYEGERKEILWKKIMT